MTLAIAGSLDIQTVDFAIIIPMLLGLSTLRSLPQTTVNHSPKFRRHSLLCYDSDFCFVSFHILPGGGLLL